MSWLLFMDESGHDHKSMPYEVRGGFAIHARKLWPFILAVRNLEQAIFGVYLTEAGTEIKGEKVLRKDRFKWAAQDQPMEQSLRRKHALNFLNSGSQGRQPRREEFTAFGQACAEFVDGIISILGGHDAKVFASIVPAVRAPAGAPEQFLRKDHVFLFERYYFFLETVRECGLIVMDGTQKEEDRRFVRRMERYFTLTHTGRQRAAWIVPTPLFVESDMAYGVQIADLLIYALNWGFRLSGMEKPTRPEIESLVQRVKPLGWQGEVNKNGLVHRTHSIVYIPDPYEDRRTLWQNKEGGNAVGTTVAVPKLSLHWYYRPETDEVQAIHRDVVPVPAAFSRRTSSLPQRALLSRVGPGPAGPPGHRELPPSARHPKLMPKPPSTLIGNRRPIQ